jgi:hypothetical protein
VNRTPRLDRQLFPDPRAESEGPHVLRVYWLEVGGKTPAKSEYEKISNKPKVMAALTAIDTVLLSGRPFVPDTLLETFTWANVKLIEIKAPKRGKIITRLLVYRESGWDLFVAFVDQKKSQKLPDTWKTTAANRVKRTLAEGGEL